jgi:hypothetical protein
MIEVWQWKYGRKTSRLDKSTPDAAARALALELIADMDQRIAGAQQLGIN